MPYSLEQVRQAYRNAIAAGDTEAAQKLNRFATQLSMQQAPPEAFDPTEGMSTIEKVRAGIGQGMVNVGRHLGNLVGLVDDEAIEEAKRRDKALLDTGAGKVGSVLGEAATLALPMGGATAGLARMGAMGARLAGGTIRRGALEGAAQGALMADSEEGLQGALEGAALGSVLPAAARAGSTAVRGIRRTPEAQALIDRGIDLTPGQMNPGGLLSKLEEDWQSAPLVGSAIAAPREAARRQWQQAIVREGAAPGAQIPEGDIDQMLDAAYKSFEPLYEQARGFPVRPVVMTDTAQDVPLLQLFRNASRARGVRATDATRKSVDKWLRNQITQFDGTSDGLLSMRSQIRAESRKARLSSNAEERAAAELLDKAEDAVTQALESQLPADALTALRVADSKYGTYKIIEDAVAAAKDAPGGFTPHQLSTAIKAATDKSSYARGAGGNLRELAAQGREVFDTRSPPTGQRLASIGIPLAVGTTNPALGIPAAGAFLGLVGTQTGRRLAAGATNPQQRLARALMEMDRLPAPVRRSGERYARALLAAGTNE